MSPALLTTFPPAPLFLSQDFRTIPPTRSLPPPLVAGTGLSPSPCFWLPRPFPAPPSPVDALRGGGTEQSAAPRRGTCIRMHVPHPIPGCLQQPGVLALCRGGRNGDCQPAVAFCSCFLASLGVSVCICQGKSLQIRLPAKGEGRVGAWSSS